MAIDAYTGLPRSGKSYSVVKNVILPSLREGRSVYTNIPLSDLLHEEFPGLIHQLPGDWFTRDDLATLFPPGAVVVLDELWRRWPSGLKTNKVPFADKEFLAEHGHLVDENGKTTRVVLVTQDLSQIAAFARDLVAMTYRSTKLDAVGAAGRFRVDVYQGAVTGQKPPKSQLVRSLFDKYDPEVYKYYKSSTKSLAGDVGDESRADKRANIWRSPFIIFSIAGPVLLIPVLLWWLIGYFSSGFGMVEAAPVPEPESVGVVNPPPPAPLTAPAVQPAPVARSQPVQVSAPAAPSDSTFWRLVGHLVRTSTSGGPNRVPDLVILQSVYGDKRLLPVTDCQLQADRLNYVCIVDGYRVASWTGRGDRNTWASSDSLISRTADAASVATSDGSPTVVNPPPSSL